MELTGERFIPGMNAQIESEHLHRYYLAREYARGKIVLDIASGEGYGSQVLSDSARHVFGVDISAEAVAHAKEKYSQVSNLEFLEGNCAKIPLPDNSVDFISSFETIEHHNQHHEMMVELIRVLKDDGILMISSPDKLVYSDATGYQNPYHVKELYQSEFEALINQYFKHVAYQSQKVFYGSIIFGTNTDSELLHFQTRDNRIYRSIPGEAPYLIAIASNAGLPHLCHGLLESSVERSEQATHLKNQIEALNSHIEPLKNEIALLRDKVNKSRNPLHRLARKWLGYK